ncbi:MAG TPA: hypothetical protein VMX13_06720 [Sedimentisphaerales bacterium]|nr:hypothetical protein [Sedimentisphaerales bacterium]
MRGILQHRANVIFVTAVVGLTAGLSEAQASNGELSREALVRMLRHQEGLVRSMECRFERSTSPTRAENIPLIHEVGKIRDYDWDYTDYILSEDFTNQESLVVHYWRKGPKELQHVFHTTRYHPDDPTASPDSSVAFDGQVVRRVHYDKQKERWFGEINNPKAGSWSNSNRIQPFSFLYEFEVMPYSELIDQGKDYAASRVDIEGKQYTKVSIRHPRLAWRSFVLLFDEELRLAERQVIAQISPDPGPRLYEKHVFTNYQRHEDASGGIIWFPTEGIYHYYMGNLSDGTPVEFKTRRMSIKEIKFNVDIPDEKFVIEFPPGTKIWDGLAGLGYMDEPVERAMDETLADLIDVDVGREGGEASPTAGERGADGSAEDVVVPASDVPPGYVEPGSEGDKSRWWAICGLIIGLLLLAGCVYWFIRIKRRAKVVG